MCIRTAWLTSYFRLLASRGTGPRATVKKSLVSVGQDRQILTVRVQVVYTDKSLFTACGPVWHQRDRLRGHVPAGLRHVDKTAAGSDSGYHGWVYG